MIPKIIHYCWFGHNPIPNSAKVCIDSWKKFFPDYEIKEWNESNFDVNMIAYTREAYDAKKYAFVSDYARFWIMYNIGGVYFDTDVEVISSMQDILEKGPFMGLESEDCVAPGLGLAANPGLGLAANPGLGLYSELLEDYRNLNFLNIDGTYNTKTIVDYTTERLIKDGLKHEQGIQFVNGIYIYPKDYFNPMDMSTGRIIITSNTRSIHHYSASWVDDYSRFRGKVYQIITSIFGKSFSEKMRHLVGRNKDMK